MAVPTFVAATFADLTDRSTGTLAVNTPAGVVAGDLLLAVVENDGGTAAPAPTPPAGWRRFFDRAQGGSDIEFVFFWRIAGASEPATHTFTGIPTGNYGVTIMMAIRGADQYAPIHIVDAASMGGTRSFVAPSLTTELNDCLLVAAFAAQTASATTWAAPGSMTLRLQRNNTTGSGFQNMMVATEDFPVAGATGTRTGTLSGATNFNGLAGLLAICPAGTTKTTDRPSVIAHGPGANNGQMAFELLTTEAINEGDDIIVLYIGTHGGEGAMTTFDGSHRPGVIDFYGFNSLGRPSLMSGLGIEVPAISAGGSVVNGLTVFHRRASGPYPVGAKFGIGVQDGTQFPHLTGAVIRFPMGMLNIADPLDAEVHTQDAAAALSISRALPTPRAKRESILLYIDGMFINSSAATARKIAVAGSEDGGSGFEKLAETWASSSTTRGVGHAIGWGISTRQSGGVWRAPNNFGVFNAAIVIAFNPYVPEVAAAMIPSAEAVYLPDVGDPAQKPSAYPLKMIL